MSLSASDLSYILGILGLLSIAWAIYSSVRTPQIDSDKVAIKLREDIDTLRDVVYEIKEKHLQSVEQDIKKLTDTIQQLSITVVKLSTIIDERIPKTKVSKK